MKRFAAVFFLIVCYAQLSTGYRLLCILPTPQKSHFITIHSLLMTLAQRGHQVDVISHYPMNDPPPNYKDISLSNKTNIKEDTLTYEKVLERGAVELRSLTTMFGKPICEQMGLPEIQNLIKNPPRDPPYDLVIIEAFVSPCWFVFGHHLNVPVVGYVATYFLSWLAYPSGNPLSTAHVSNSLSTYYTRMSFWQRLTNTVVTHALIGQINYYLSSQNEILRRYFGPDVPNVNDLMTNVSLYLVNSHYSISHTRPVLANIVDIAGIRLIGQPEEPLDEELKRFLDESEHGCVYFSFGVLARFETFPKEVVLAFYAAFRNIAPVRVLMRITNKDLLPPGLSENVMVRSWCPQPSVLKHKNIRAFISQCGSSMLESISSGVPIVAIPLIGDQHINTLHCVMKDIAIRLNLRYDLTEEKITNAINTILNDPFYKRNAERLSKLFLDRPMNPLDTAVYWVEFVARHGPFMESPGTYLTWWQQSLLDVYAVLFLVAIIIIYLLLRTFAALTRAVINAMTFAKRPVATNDKKGK